MELIKFDKQQNGLSLHKLRCQFLFELEHGILPFWLKYSVDEGNGGFHGRVENEGKAVPRSNKGLILNTRILWAFSAAYSAFGNTEYLKMADRAWEYIIDHFIDRAFGGAYWMLDFQGRPVEDKKKVYGHAFLIYSLAEYFRATGKQTALDLAVEIFDIIERRFLDPENGGYFETTLRDWTSADDMRLSAVDLNEKKSMNAHLHILEAYTGLLRVWPDSRLKKQLNALLNDFLHHIINRQTWHFHLFFNEFWEPKSDAVSPGHDIEGSWLLWESALVINDPGIKKEVGELSIHLSNAVYEKCLDPDGGLIYENHDDNEKNLEKHWWVQAEAMAGFLNAYQLSGDYRFYTKMLGVWEYIRENLIDQVNGEWFYKRTEDGVIAFDQFKISEWKGPYHNSRACLEMARRLDLLS